MDEIDGFIMPTRRDLRAQGEEDEVRMECLQLAAQLRPTAHPDDLVKSAATFYAFING